MKVRAKFTVTEVRQHSWSPTGRTIVLSPVYDQSVPEDQRFAQATPSGRLEMFVDNPAVVEGMPVGRVFYLDFVPVE